MSAFPASYSLPKLTMEPWKQQTRQYENGSAVYQRCFAKHSHETGDRKISGMRNWNKISAFGVSLPMPIIPGNEARMKTPTASLDGCFPRKLIFVRYRTRRYSGSSIFLTPGHGNVLAGRHLIRYSMNTQVLHLEVECRTCGVAKYKTICYYACMIPVKEKSDIISKFRIHETDTGSSDVQIAVLSEEIGRLASHLENHPKDNHSRRGLLKMVAQRKKLLSFLSRENEDRYQVVIKKLGLKK